LLRADDAEDDPNAPLGPFGSLPAEDDPFDPAYRGHLPSPRWAVAAAGAIGMLWADYADAFQTLPLLPASARLEAFRAQYLMSMIDPPSEPMRVRAKHACLACLRLADANRIADEHAEACDVWLAGHYRAEHHRLEEFGPTVGLPGPEPGLPMRKGDAQAERGATR
jgi:hypothetical protein